MYASFPEVVAQSSPEGVRASLLIYLDQCAKEGQGEDDLLQSAIQGAHKGDFGPAAELLSREYSDAMDQAAFVGGQRNFLNLVPETCAELEISPTPEWVVRDAKGVQELLLEFSLQVNRFLPQEPSA